MDKDGVGGLNSNDGCFVFIINGRQYSQDFLLDHLPLQPGHVHLLLASPRRTHLGRHAAALLEGLPGYHSLTQQQASSRGEATVPVGVGADLAAESVLPDLRGVLHAGDHPQLAHLDQQRSPTYLLLPLLREGAGTQARHLRYLPHARLELLPVVRDLVGRWQ